MAAVGREQSPWILVDRLLVLHSGIDLSHWPLRAPKLAGDRFRLLFVGCDLVRKGIETLLNAFNASLYETCDLDIATQSIWLSADLKTRILNTPSCSLYLDLTPATEELQRLYREADAFVLPTNLDSSPFVALEAMPTGVPVVITPLRGITDIVRDGETGLLISPKDPAALVRAIDRLRADRALCSKISEQARNTWREILTLTRTPMFC